MSNQSILAALPSRRMATLIRNADRRVIYAAPGIQTETATACAERRRSNEALSFTVSLDFDEHTLRMGYGTLKGVQILQSAGIEPTHFPGLRSGILIVDNRGWIFTPTALYLEPERLSDETPNAVELSAAQVNSLAISLSPAAQQEAIEAASTAEEAEKIAAIPSELGVNPVHEKHMEAVKEAIETAPPVKFDVVRQVRVFEPYLQYVELSLTGAAVQRHRIQIPKSLQQLGNSKDLEGRLRTTFDLIEKGGSLSSKPLEDKLNDIRKNFTPSLGKDHGRVVLKSAKEHLNKRIAELKAKLDEHQKKVESELQSKIDESKKQVVAYYLPLAMANPPDALLGGLLNSGTDEEAIRSWLGEELTHVFPSAQELTQQMTLEARFKDVTFETLNEADFMESLKAAFPRVNWNKAYNDFKAAGETRRSRGHDLTLDIDR